MLDRGSEKISEHGSADYDIKLNDVLRFFARTWVPLPMFRQETDRGKYFQGPINWARVYVVPLETRDERGNDYRLVVAVDTALMEHVQEGAYLAPTPDDARNGRSFSVPDRESYNFLLLQPWMRDWLTDLYRRKLEEAERAKQTRRKVVLSDEEIEDRKEGPNEPIARYMAFIDLLERLDILPSLVLTDTLTSVRQQYVDVDMVLDLGNSRTCVLMMEADPGSRSVDLSQARTLRLRDFSRPEQVYEQPFESRFEFSVADFGLESHSFQSGRTDAFVWPTLVRVGPEAVRLAGRRRGAGRTGMSSPKRYLWDEEPSQESWCFNSSDTTGDQKHYASQGPFALRVNDIGQALHCLEEDDDDAIPSFRATYARSNLVTFVLAEVLMQSLAWINAPAHRNERIGTGNLPRRLRRIILTMPTALSLAERELLRRHADAARDLVYLCLARATPKDGGRPGELDWHGEPAPEIVLKWDEASATQLVYFYQQIAMTFSGDAFAFFRSFRGEGEDRTSLRVATLDIGGGTSDLVITRIEARGRGATVTLFPSQLFRESFSLAGDDIVHKLARDIVVNSFRQAVAAMPGVGRDRADALVQKLFGGNRGGMTAEEHKQRRLFASQIAAPAAISILSQYETFDPVRPPPAATRKLAELIVSEQLPEDVAAFINGMVRDVGGDADFSLLDLDIPMDLVEVDRLVRELVGDMLRALTEVAWRFNVDVMLLSGRPSRFPAIRDVILETGALPAHRVVAMHTLRVGEWYSFRDSEARISDPKTTAAVGGMICLLAEGHLTNFNFRSDDLYARSVARYFGKIGRDNRLLAQDVYYSDLDLENENYEIPEATFEFRGPVDLGIRQFEQEWWPASMLYSLDYASEADRKRLQAQTPIALQLEQMPFRPRPAAKQEIVEKLVNDRLTVKSRGLKMQLQTLHNRDGYWLDTGVLIDV